MSDQPRFNFPTNVVVDDTRYNYRRFVGEMLICETCDTTFFTHIPSGVGAVMTPKGDTVFCAGCLEVMTNLDIRDEGGGAPS